MDRQGGQIGFFGKMPGYGDFVRRDLPGELTKRWDAWLQNGLAESRKTLDERWLDRYLSSPIWRFCLSAGLCGDAQWMGAMMPSVDRIGRYFPLTAATEIPPHRSLFGTAAAAESWFALLEETLLAALHEDSLTTEQLQTRLAALDRPGGDAGSGKATTLRRLADHGGFASVRLADLEDLKDAAGLLADALAQDSCGPFSIWWSSGSAYVAPDVRIYSDLPPAELFWTLLDERLGD